jgi:hypothetical protein
MGQNCDVVAKGLPVDLMAVNVGRRRRRSSSASICLWGALRLEGSGVLLYVSAVRVVLATGV